MKEDIIRRLLSFLILVLVQALVCNHVHVLGYATPLPYVYFSLTFSRNYPRWAILLWCFVLGLTVDVFSNTPGLASGALTLIGLLQPYVLSIFMTREHAENFRPRLATMGFVKYCLFAMLLVFLFCLTLFSLEAFSFFNWQHWLFSILGSSIITFVIVLAIENVRGS